MISRPMTLVPVRLKITLNASEDNSLRLLDKRSAIFSIGYNISQYIANASRFPVLKRFVLLTVELCPVYFEGQRMQKV